MKFNKAFLMTILVLGFLLMSSVCASDLGTDKVNNLSDSNDNYLDGSTIYVDDVNGNNANNGTSRDSSLKSLDVALNMASDNCTISLADGNYAGLANTRLTVNKSVSFIGSDNTVFDGENKNYIFIVSNNTSVTFKNIKFINAYKSPTSYSVSYDDNIFGAALDIKNATVTIDNCQFLNNVLEYGTIDKYIYGGAISNFGDLTITNSYFENNTALSTSGLFSYGGSVYNKGRLFINNSVFNKSRSVNFGYGAALANDGSLTMHNSIISNSRALHECKGSAVYNTRDFVLLDSIIENNYIERANFNYIYGVIYNSGNFQARGNIFRNNSGYYEAPNPSYKGSPNIYNIGTLNLTYNAFFDNAPFEGISRDVFFNGGEVISLDNNWWNTNENPYIDGTRINIDLVDSWLVFSLMPEYSMLNVSDSVKITASWTNNINQVPQIDFFPVFNVTFSTSYGEKIEKQLIGGETYFIFNHSQNKGSFVISASVGGFSKSVLVDVGKVLTSLDVENNDNITYRDPLNVKIAVKSRDSSTPAGQVSVYIGDMTYKLNLTNGNANVDIDGLLPGDYTLKVVYEGDDDHFKAFFNKTVSINKQSVDLSVVIPEIMIDQKGSAIVSLLPMGVQGQAILYIDGVRKKIVYLYNGNTTIALNNFAEGEYNISMEFVETNFYKRAFASAMLKVSKYDSSLKVSAEDVGIGENATVVVSVTPNTLRGEAILSVNGINSTIYLNNDTTYINLFGLQGGSYDVTVFFNGDSKYHPSNASTSFNVQKKQTSLDVKIVEDEKNLNGTITVNINPSVCTGVIGVYVNYNHYTANITNGKAKFNVKFGKGTNYVFVYYEGNEEYRDSSWNTTIGVDDDFVFIGENSTGWKYNDFNYSVRLLEVTGIPMPNREVTIKFDNAEYTVRTNDDGFAYFTLNLPVGKYDIAATYKNATISNKLTVNDIKFNVTTQNIVYGDSEIIRVDFDNGISGNVTFAVDGISQRTIEIINNTAVCSVSGLNVGDYTVKVTYSNSKFVSDEVTGTFSVDKVNLELNVSAGDCTYDVDQIIVIGNLKNATGNLTIIVNGKEYVKKIENSQVILNLSKLATGKYLLTVNYPGDRNYNNASSDAVFYVKEMASDIILNVAEARYGEDITAVATLNKNATGMVHFAVGNLSKDIEITDGMAVWTFSGLDVGSYNLSAKYLGDHYYVSSSNSTSFSIAKAKSQMNITVGEVVLNENIRIYAHLSPNATGKVKFSMVGYYSPRSKDIINSTAMWYIAPLKTGTYTVIATYDGDENYYASNATYQLKVSQKKSLLDVEIDDAGINDRVIAKISLTSSGGDLITGRISLKIGEKSYSILVNNGKSSFVIGRLAEGNYTFMATYDGNENYSKSSCEGKFIVRDSLLDVKLVAKNVVKYYKGSQKLVISLLSPSGKAIASETVNVRINGKNYALVTDKSGKAEMAVDLASGNYVAYVSFAETSRYRSASTTAWVNISSTVGGIDVVKIYGSGTQYFAIFCDSNGKALANVKVTFKIGTRSFTTTTLPNGISRLNINFKVGKYKIQATNPVTGEKTYNKILIYKRLAGNKNVVQYYGANKYYKVRAYANNGKPVGAGVIVKIKINGKVHKVKTNKNGYAKLKIKLKPRTYTVTATYKGYKVSNKIKVKSTVITKNLYKKKSKNKRFTAKLVNSKGKILKGKMVTFKFRGKKYVVKTNKKGKAGIWIRSNLKVGKYNIVTSYGKLKVKNKIIVRR